MNRTLQVRAREWRAIVLGVSTTEIEENIACRLLAPQNCGVPFSRNPRYSFQGDAGVDQ